MRHGIAYGLLFASFGCAASTTIPPELLSARATYDRASHGPTAALDPADLREGEESLEAAERSFIEHGNTWRRR